MALKHHMERYTIHKLSIQRHGSGYDKLHWPTVFSILYQVFVISMLRSLFINLFGNLLPLVLS